MFILESRNTGVATDVCLVCFIIELPDDGLTQRPSWMDLLAENVLESKCSSKSFKITGIRTSVFSCRMEFLKVRDACGRTGLILSRVAVLALVMSDQATFRKALVLKITIYLFFHSGVSFIFLS